MPYDSLLAQTLGHRFVRINGDTMTGLLILSGDPVQNLGAATKQYVDAHSGGGGFGPQTANTVFSGPTSGAPASPNFRPLVPADLPNTAVTPGPYGTATQVGQFTVDAQGRLTFAQNMAIGGLDTGVITTGQLPIARGGTGQSTALAALNALSPLTTRGDMLTRDTTNNIRVGLGAVGTYWRSNGTDPGWSTIQAGDVPSTTAIAGDVTGTLAATLIAKINGVRIAGDPFSQYLYLPGRVGKTNDAIVSLDKVGTISGSLSQSIGGLTLQGSAHPNFAPLLNPVVMNTLGQGRVGIGTATPVGLLEGQQPNLVGVGKVNGIGLTLVGTDNLGATPGPQRWNTPGDSGQLHAGDTIRITSGVMSGFVLTVTGTPSDNTHVGVDLSVAAVVGATYTYSPPLYRSLDSTGAVKIFESGAGRIAYNPLSGAPRALLEMNDAAPPVNPNGNGLNALPVILLSGANGGASSLDGGAGGNSQNATMSAGSGGASSGLDAVTGTNTGGNAGIFSIFSGGGGSVTNGRAGGQGGNAGILRLRSGAGGDVTNSSDNTATGGPGALLDLSAGRGGNVPAGAGNTGGNGGNASLQPGAAGTGGTPGTVGQVLLATTNPGSVNIGTGGLRIGDTTRAGAYLDIIGLTQIASTGAVNVGTAGLRIGDLTAPTGYLDIIGRTVLNSAGLATKYNNLTTVGQGVAPEIAAVDLTGNSAALGSGASATSILASVGGAGVYRIVWYLKVTTPATTSSTLGPITFKFSDNTDGVAQTFTAGGFTQAGVAGTTNTGNTTTTTLSGVTVIWSVDPAATNIKYGVGYGSVGGTAMQYEVHMKLEALG